MQLDPAPGSRKPFLHQLGVMIARVVEKDMDERQHRIERRDQFQEPDRRDGVDGYDLDHPGLAGREIDRAVNIDPLAPARLFDRELLLSWCPAAGRPRRMGRMHRVREQHGFVVGQGIQEIIVALDECLLLLFVEFARDDWLSAAVGIASGAGQFLLVLLGTGLGAFIVSLVWLLERLVTANSPLEQASRGDDRRETNHSAG